MPVHKKLTNNTLPVSQKTNVSVAQRLRNLEEHIATLQQEALAMRQTLLDSLQTQGIRSVSLENGYRYTRVPHVTLIINDVAKANAWAIESPQTRMKLNQTAALTALAQDKNLASFFEKKKTEYLRVVYSPHGK